MDQAAHEDLKPLYDWMKGPMPVALLMGKDSAAFREVLQYEQQWKGGHTQKPYAVNVIIAKDLTDGIRAIAAESLVPAVRTDWTTTDPGLQAGLGAGEVKVIAYDAQAGVLPDQVLRDYTCIGLHPSDLTLRDMVRPRYNGLDPIRQAILAGEEELMSTVYLAGRTADAHKILVRSATVPVNVGEDFDPHNEDLVEKITAAHRKLVAQAAGITLTHALSLMGTGRIEKDERDHLYINGQPLRDTGARIDEDNILLL